MGSQKKDRGTTDDESMGKNSSGAGACFFFGAHTEGAVAKEGLVWHPQVCPRKLLSPTIIALWHAAVSFHYLVCLRNCRITCTTVALFLRSVQKGATVQNRCSCPMHRGHESASKLEGVYAWVHAGAYMRACASMRNCEARTKEIKAVFGEEGVCEPNRRCWGVPCCGLL